MYEKVSNEIAAVKTPKFHRVFKLPIDQEVFTDGLSLGLPHAYLQFLKEIGKALLFRSGDGYLVGVYPISEEIPVQEKDIALCFGHCTTGKAFFLRSTLSSSFAPVYKKTGREFIRSELDFEAWIKTAMELARGQFGKKEWERILAGPKPFNEDEREILASRRMFQWRLAGETDSGMARFEVTNNSSICLPYLSIGIREIHGKFDGKVWLNVSHIKPGECAIIEQDCYSDLAALNQVEPYALDDPGPEDRERYREFRRLPKG